MPASPRLRTVLILLVALAILPVFVLTILGTLSEQDTRRAEVAGSVLRVARLVAAQQEQLVESTRQLLMALAHTPEVIGGRGPECSALLADMLPYYPEYANLGVVKADGTLECSALPTARAIREQHRSIQNCIQRVFATGDFAASGYEIGVITKRPIVTFGYPVTDAAGRTVAVVFAALDLRWLQDFEKTIDLPHGAVLMVADTTGTVLSRYPGPPAWIGRRLPVARELAERLQRGPDGVVEFLHVDREPWLYAYAALPPLAMFDEFVAIGIPRAAAFARIDHALFRGVIVLIAVFVLGSAAAWLIGRDLVLRPVQALSAAATRLESGEPGVRTGIRSGSLEFVDLARTFDHMAATLEHREATIVRVADTQQLLADAGAALTSSLDYQETLGTVSRLAIPLLADWCIIDVIEDHVISRIAMAHRDPEKEALLRDTAYHFVPTWDGVQPAARAIRSGTPEVVDEAAGAKWERYTQSAEHHRLLKELGARSVLAVPLTARGHTLGAITLGSAHRSYSEDDIAFAEDLARRMAMAIDNARLYQGQVAANRAKSDFLGIVSHELRTPLTAIVGYADLLSEEITGPLTPGQKEQLARITASADNLLALIDEILTYANLEAGRESVRPARFDLRRLIERVAVSIRPLAETKGLRFTVRPPEAPTEVVTDEDKLRHILINLLSNAVHFTEKGEIELAARVVEDRIIITVRDTGLGIAPEHRDRIFEPFWQVEEVTTRRVGGTGLGLSVARRLARLLGGDVTVESRLGEGSVFTVELPANERAARKGGARGSESADRA